MEIKRTKDWPEAFITVIFFISLLIFLFWLEPFADYPLTDEYQSLLSALGFPVYTPNLYVYFLRLFTGVFDDFDSLMRFNFIASQFVLCLCFFLYHWKKNINLATNLVMTGLLSMSTINIALTRKMHFWAAAFFLFIIFVADFLNGKKKNLFLVLAFTLLGFFRVEFFLSAIAALVLWLSPHLDRRKKWLLMGLGTVLVIGGIAQFGYGMKDLLRESFKLDNNQQNFFILIPLWGKIFFSNLSMHLFYSVSSLYATFRLYFFTLPLAFVLLFFFSKNFKENAQIARLIFKNEILPFLAPACFALFSIRFMDFYIITTFVFVLSALTFLLNTKKSMSASVLLLTLVLGAFFIRRPDFIESSYINFPTYRRGERVYRQTFALIRGLEMKPGIEPYKILINQYVAGVLPFEDREYYQFSDLPRLCEKGTEAFDVVLLPGKWITIPEQNFIENCVRPTLSPMKHIKIAPGYDLYVSSRINLEKISLK